MDQQEAWTGVLLADLRAENTLLWEIVRAVADADCTCSIELADTMNCIFDCGGRVDLENYPTIRFYHTETCPATKARALVEQAKTGKEHA